MVIKQIIYDELTGKLMLHDSDNNHYECNLYGDRKPSFIPNITGVADYQTRINNNPIRSFSHHHDIQYCPVTRKFEGYMQFPRPLCPPFSNVPSCEINEQNKRKLIKTLSKYFKRNSNNKKLFEISNDNKGLSFISHSLNPYDSSRKDTRDIIKLIDKHFEEYKEKNKYQLNLMPKDPVIKALTRFKNVLLSNKDMTIIHNKKLNSPNRMIRSKYKLVDKHVKYLSSNLNKEAFLSYFEHKEEAKMKNSQSSKQIDELSFISNQTDNDINYMKDNMINVKSLEFLEKNCEKEKNSSVGLKENKIKLVPKLLMPNIKLRTCGQSYDEDMKILRKCNLDIYYLANPMAFEMRKKKEEFDHKQLTKKKNQSKIHQDNLGFKVKK